MLACTLAIVVRPGRLAAQSRGRARLEYTLGAGAETCPDGRWLEESVAAQLGRRVFAPEAERVFRVRVSRAGAEWLATFEVLDAAGQRVGTRRMQMRAAGCRDIADALSFALSLAVDAFPAPTPEPAPTPDVPPPPPPRVEEVPLPRPVVIDPPVPQWFQRAPRAPSTTPLEVSLGFDLGVAGGTVPEIVPNLGATLALRRGRWGAELGLGYLFAGQAAGNLPGTVVRVDALRASLGPCGWFSPLRVCLPLRLSRTSGTARGLSETNATALPSLRLGVRLDLVLGSVNRFEFRVFAEGTVALVRNVYQLVAQPVWTDALVDLIGGLAMAYRFP